jgi:quercetin dioxygenase-like cupin family protein
MRAHWRDDRGGVVETRNGTMFSGVVWGEVQLPHDSGVGVNRVTFAPRSRTFWHRHLGGQMLLGHAGSGLVVTRDAVVHIGDGTVVHAAAGEEHWHGALPDSYMTHQSVVLGGDTQWLEEVSDEEYLAAVEQLRASSSP